LLHLLDIPVRYRTRLLRIEPAADHLRLHLDVDGRETEETTRKIILANGVAGGGGTEFAIAGTGYFVDPAARPDFSDFARHIARWRDRVTLPTADDHAALAAYPYLGAAHEFLERTPGDAPFLKDINNFNPSGFVSRGLPVGDILSFMRDIPAIVARISRDLFSPMSPRTTNASNSSMAFRTSSTIAPLRIVT
jgi:cation diffusion facilitator CzcD-associated flavoprotein CzcO